MTEASEKLREVMKNPKDTLISLHTEYGLDQKEFSKILIITCTALLFVSIQVTGTLDSVQDDLQETDDQVQQASAVISSDSFQQAMNTLQRVQSQSVTNQIETAQNAFQSAQESFERISTAEEKVGESKRMYQWLSLISILGIVTGVALRFM